MLLAVAPSWWSDTGTQILEEEGSEENYAPANLGQLKHVAKMAKEHLDESVAGGAGSTITTMVAGFEPRAGMGYTQPQIDVFLAENYAPINLGQLKAVAKPFYDRLKEAGYDTKANLIARGYPGGWEFDYPWDPETALEENYAPANLGQLKMVFSFDLASYDTDLDGLPDEWEEVYIGDTYSDGEEDLDGDGLTNWEEFQNGTHPNESDSDDDGLPDGWEVAHGLDPLVDDSADDADGDGYTNLQEYIYGLDPNAANPQPQVAAGAEHTLILKADGTVWACGVNQYGQLGDGTTTTREKLVKISSLSGVICIAAGQYHSLAVKSDGTVWTWGRNNQGQLGDNSTTQRNSPVQVSSLSGVVSVVAGNGHSVALKGDGTLSAWGKNVDGQAGDGTTTQRNTPVAVSGLTGITEIAAGSNHTSALKSDGTVWSWGYNDLGRLGDGTTTSRSTPVQVTGLTGITSVAGGGNHGAALKSDGTVWSWGSNVYGQIGVGTTGTTGTLSPTQASSLTGVSKIAGSGYQTLAIKSDGTLWVWGNNANAAVGDGTEDPITVPKQINGWTNVIAIAGNHFHNAAVRDDGSIWIWGRTALNNLGDGSYVWRSSPAEISNAPQAAAVSLRHNHGLLLHSGTLFDWGRNEYGSLGDGTLAQKPTLQIVEGVGNVAAISAGTSHSLICKTDGTIWAVGYNEFGQLGDNTTTLRTSFVQSSTLAGVTAVSAGRSHSLALRNTGTAYAWGRNNLGQLGDGTTTQRNSPVVITGLGGGVAKLSSGDQFNLALKSNGSVWAWGRNNYGQLGDTTTTNRTTPFQISGLSNISAIAAGTEHSMVIKNDGTVWTWGRNSNGQLGDNTTTQRNSPVQASSLTDIVAISGGNAHSLAVKADGTVWAWGDNTHGQLGDGTTIQRNTPVQVTDLSGVVAVYAGQYCSLAKKVDGTLCVWGANTYGQLAIGYSESIPAELGGVNGFFSSPVVSITTPSSPATQPLAQPLALSFSGSGTTDLDHFELYHENIKLREVDAAETNVTWTPATWGTYHLSIVAIDERGVRSAKSNVIRVQVPFDGDTDGMPDWWEMAHFGSLTSTASADADGDGFTNLQEYEGHGDPNDYFDQAGTLVVPVISIAGGDNQPGSPGEYLSQPLLVEVRSGSSTGTLLNNAPVTFNVTTGNGGLAAGPNVYFPPQTLSVRTGTSGVAQAYYQQGDVGSSDVIEAISGSAGPVAFETHGIGEDWLVGSWSFNEGSGTSLADDSGLANHATLVTPGVVFASSFSEGSALQFDGTGNGEAYVPSGTNSPRLDFGDRSFTISFWFKSSQSDHGRLVGNGSWHDLKGYAVKLTPNVSSQPGRLGFNLTSSGTSVASPADLLLITQDAFNDEAWHHVAAVVDRDESTVHLYVDGVSQEFDATTSSGTGLALTNGVAGADISAMTTLNADSDDRMSFGQHQGEGDPYEGLLDEVRVYARALTEDDIVALEDSDHDEMPDWWELKYFGTLNALPDADADLDLVSNLQEYLDGTNPNTSVDTDADGLPDAWEQAVIDADPSDDLEDLSDIDPLGNLDGDSVTNFEEWELGLNPLDASDAQGAFEILSGNEQTVPPSEVAPEPLEIQVKNYTEVAMEAATIKVRVADGSGRIRVDGSSDPFSQSIEVITDGAGKVFVELESGSDPGQETRLLVEATFATGVEGKLYTEGWLGQWMFNEGFGEVSVDQSPFGRSVTLNEVSWEEGIYGPAVGFSVEAGSSASIETSASTLHLGKGSFSVASWFKTEQEDEARLLGQGFTNEQSGFAVEMNEGRVIAKFGVPGEGGIIFTTTGTFNDGDWHHLATVFDREAGTLKIFIDGSQRSVQLGEPPAGSSVTSGTVPAGLSGAEGQPLVVGLELGVGKYYEGWLDTIALYRGVLTSDQIEDLAEVAFDLDADGLPDDWEQQLIDADPADAFENLSDINPGDDFDGDGTSNLDEFFAGSDAKDFYNGMDPVIVILTGDRQSGTPGVLLAKPMLINVLDSGGRILTNSPLEIIPGDPSARIQVNSGTLVPSASFRSFGADSIVIRP